MISQQRFSDFAGRPSSVAKTFIVPSGSSPSVVSVPAIPLTTSLIVPSPPAATTVSNPSATARCAKRWASPRSRVSQTSARLESAAIFSCQCAARSPRAAGFRMTGMALITSQPAGGGYGSRVRTLVRRSITALITVTALLGIIFLGANLYVQSPSSQQQIKHHLTAAFGMPVEMVRAVFTPWGGLRVDGVRAAGGSGQPVISADIVRVRISFWSLLRGRFVVKTIGLERPTVTMTQNSEGRWMAPLRMVAAATPMEVPDPATKAAPAPSASPGGTPPRHTAVAPTPPPPSLPDVLVPAP